MVDGDELTTFNGQMMKIRDVPDAFVRHMLGFGHSFKPGRDAVRVKPDGPWPYEPDVCPRADEQTGVWLNKECEPAGPDLEDGEYLVCPGCGLDCT